MAKPPNKLLRVVVPILLIVAGVGIAAAVFINSRPSGTPKPGAPVAQGPSAPVGSSSPQPAGQAAGAPAAAQPVVPVQTGPLAVSLDGLKALVVGSGAVPAFEPIGDLDAKGDLEARVEFSAVGAGVKSIELAHHFETIKFDTHTLVQREHVYQPPLDANGGTPPPQQVTPLAALAVEINGQVAPLLGIGGNIWTQTERTRTQSTFEATIVNGEGTPVARVRRTYRLEPGSYVVRLAQTVQNLTPDVHTVRWFQFGPVDLEQDAAGYGGDKRRVRFGYLLPPATQGGDPTVSASDFVWPRAGGKVMGPTIPGSKMYETVRPIWPNQVSTRAGYRQVWAGMTNRYFGTAVHPLVAAGAGPDQKVFTVASEIDRVLLQQFVPSSSGYSYSPVIILRTTSAPVRSAAGGTADLSMGFYAGPLSRPEIAKDPIASAAGLYNLVVYNFGGPCGWCTFGLLTGILLGLLHFLHNYIVFDWALAIIVLVLVVRTTLHPVTRWSQIRLQRFGKQMQGMAPKQKKVQEKYKDDPKKMREEMGKLWREEGISPTGALGCIPMFLQTPVWIALYATLYFAIELRHQGAFFGVFQAIFPGHPGALGWFLGDLAEPDRFIYFGHDLITLPLLGPISSFNVLPIILGVVFFVQQKYLTPPPTATMTPEQLQQQKLMKWMMVLMFPLFMYNAPSGLALYFIANSTLGILESKWIRKHIEELDKRLPPPGARKPAPKSGGFVARLMALAEERQKQMAKAKGNPPPRRK